MDTMVATGSRHDGRERNLRPIIRHDAVPPDGRPSSELDVLLRRSMVESAVHELVRDLYLTPPVEMIRGSRRANTGYLASAKVGRLIPFNSRNYEYPAALRLEYDPRCVCYFPQPGSFTIERHMPDGTVRKTTYRPDFVEFLRLLCADAIARVEIVFIQCKSEEELRAHPELFVWADGRWHDYDAERALRAMFGARHEIWTTPDFDDTLIANLRVLRPKLATAGNVPADIRERVVTLLRSFPGETLADVRRKLPEVAADHVHELILQGVIAARLDRDRLDFPETVRLFACAAIALALDFPATVAPTAAADETAFKIGLDVRWYGRKFTIANLSTTTDGVEKVLLSLPDGSTVWVARSELVKDARSRQFAVLNAPHENALRFLGGTKSDAENAQLAKNILIAHRLRAGATPSGRQERRIAVAIRAAADAGVSLAEQLQPKLHLRGRRGDKDHMRMPDPDPAKAAENKRLLVEYIGAYASDAAAGTISSHYDRYELAATDVGCRPVSLETFRRRVHALPTQSTVESREGHRAANAAAPAQRSLSIISVSSPRAHGEVLVDHTKLAVMMVAVRGERIYPVGRGWLTLAVCSQSTKIMSHVLLCDAPSYATLQLLVRGYRDRYGRIPDAWSHDNGAEFGSWFWVLLNGDRGADIHAHPVAHSRFGSEVELTFGALDRRLWDNVLGGTKSIQHRRRMTRAYDPQRQTPWTLRDVDKLVTGWIEAHNNTPLRGIEKTPNELYKESLETVGSAPEREIAAGRDWDWFSFPRPDRVGLVTVRRGEMQIKGVTYTSPELAALPDVSRVEARFDPFDRSHAMARVDDTPVYLTASERFDFLRHISENDRKYASMEATKALGRRRKAGAYAEFMRSVIERQDSLRALRAGDQRMLLEANGQLAASAPPHASAAEESYEDITLADVQRELTEVSS